jgi:hypothetical protein
MDDEDAVQLVGISLDVHGTDAARLGGRRRERDGLHELAGRIVENHTARQAVDARRLKAPGATGRQPGEANEGIGDQRATVKRTRHGADLAAAVGHHHRVFGQHPGQRIHVEIAHRLAEGAEQPLALLLIDFAAGVVGLDMDARATGKLAAGGRAARKAPPDLVEVQVEHFVQQEGCALQRRQPLQRKHERHRNVLRELGLCLRVGRPAGLLVHQWLGQPDADILLASRDGRAQLVQAQIGHQAREIGVRMLDGAFVDFGPAQPGLLHDVLGLGARAEHAVSKRAQAARVFTIVAQGAFGEGRHDVRASSVKPVGPTSRRSAAEFAHAARDVIVTQKKRTVREGGEDEVKRACIAAHGAILPGAALGVLRGNTGGRSAAGPRLQQCHRHPQRRAVSSSR